MNDAGVIGMIIEAEWPVYSSEMPASPEGAVVQGERGGKERGGGRASAPDPDT